MAIAFFIYLNLRAGCTLAAFLSNFSFYGIYCRLCGAKNCRKPPENRSIYPIFKFWGSCTDAS